MHTFLVVIYKRRISEVVTLQSLSQMCFSSAAVPSLFIWDNSPAHFEQEPLDRLDAFRQRFDSVEYHRATENSGLSVLYNRVLDKILRQAGARVTILDHDSELSSDFCLKIEAAVAGARFVVPKVVSNRTGRMISPRYQASHYFSIRPPAPKTLAVAAAGEQCAQDFFAVGSGMTITEELWSSGIRFDETLSFYGIDTEFCRDYSVAHRTFALADTIVLHDISSEGAEDPAIAAWRFNSHMDYWVYQLRKHSSLPGFAIGVYVAFWRALIGMHFFLKRIRPKRVI